MAENANGNGGPDLGNQKQFNDLLNTAQGLMDGLGLKGTNVKKIFDQITGGHIKSLDILKEELDLMKKKKDIYQEYKELVDAATDAYLHQDMSVW